MPPFPQFNVVTSLCFERPSKKTAISVRMPACIGQQHWSRGRGGIRYDVTTCRRMAVFFEEPGEDFFGLWMCKYRLEPIPFCICQNLNPSTLAASNLLPTKQRRNRFVFFVYGCANASLNKFPFARAKTPIQTHFHLQSCYPQTKKQHCSICSARGQKLEIRAVCLAWCTNVECACTPPEAELQRSADENIRGHKHCVLHSARTVHATVHVTVHGHETL